jgi:hypothetical protein
MKCRQVSFPGKKSQEDVKDGTAEGFDLKILVLPNFRSSCDAEEWSQDHAINSGTKLGGPTYAGRALSPSAAATNIKFQQSTPDSAAAGQASRGRLLRRFHFESLILEAQFRPEGAQIHLDGLRVRSENALLLPKPRDCVWSRFGIAR